MPGGVESFGRYERPKVDPKNPPLNQAQAVSSAEQGSSGTLPTDVVLDIAGIGQNEREIARISRMLARDWQVPPRYIFGDPKAAKQQLGDGRDVSMADIRRASNRLAPAAIASMIADITHSPGEGRVMPKSPNLDAKQVAKLAQVVASERPDMKFDQGIALAAALAEAGVRPNQFAQNLGALKAWAMNSPVDSWGLAINLALDGKVLKTTRDVQVALFGEEAVIAREEFDVKRTELQAEGLGRLDPLDPESQMGVYQDFDSEIAAMQQSALLEGDLASPILGELTPDFQARIDEIAADIKADETALENSLFGKAIAGPVDYAFDRLTALGYRWVMEVSTPIVMAERLARVPLDEQFTAESAIRQTLDERHTIIERLNLSDDEVPEMESQVLSGALGVTSPEMGKTGTPSYAYALNVQDEWWAPAFDLFIAMGSDPAIFAGKALGAAHKLRTLPGLTDKPSMIASVGARAAGRSDSLTSLAETYNTWRRTSYQKRVEAFVSSKAVNKMFDAIENESEFMARARGFWSRYDTAGGLPDIYIAELRRAIVENVPAGPARLKEFQDGMRAMLVGGWAPETSVAANIAISRTTQINNGVEEALLGIGDEALKLEPDLPSQWGPLTNPALNEAIDHTVLPMRLEVPRPVRGIPGFGARKAIAQRSRLGSPTSGARSEFSYNPGRQFNIESDPVTYIRENGEYASLPEAKIAELETDMARAVSTPIAREARAEEVIQRMNDAIFEEKLAKVLGPKGQLTDQAREELRGIIFNPFKARNQKRQSFSVIPQELDTSIPRTLDDLTPKQRVKVYGDVKKQVNNSPSYQMMDDSERQALLAEFRKWAKGGERPNQAEWMNWYTARQNMDEHMQDLADLEDRIRELYLHNSIANTRNEPLSALYGPKFRAQVISALPQRLRKFAGKDLDRFIETVVRLDPEGGMLKYALQNPKNVPWSQRGFVSNLRAELEDVLGADLLTQIGSEATTTREFMGLARKITKFNSPFPLHPEDIAQRLGVSLDTEEDIREALKMGNTRVNTHRPMSQAQLQNTFYVPDPVDIERSIEQYVGLAPRVKRQGNKGFTIEGQSEQALELWGRKKEEQIRSAGRAYKRIWRAGAVARPAYVTRVILLDENARAMFSKGLLERVLSTRTGGRMAAWTRAYDIPIYGRNGELLTVIPPSGSTRYAREPLASSTMRQQELLDETVRRGPQGRSLTTTGGYDELLPTDKGHTEAWANELLTTYGETEQGVMVMQAIEKGQDIATTRAELLAWANGPGRSLLKTRLGVNPKDFGRYVDDLTASGYYYTKNNPELAAAVRARTPREKLARHLKRVVAPSERPNVIGHALIDQVKPSFVTRATNTAYRWFVSGREDVLNRQPFFRSMKRSAEDTIWTEVKAAGTEVTDQTRRAVDVASTRYGLEQTKRIMFDFTRQQRILERMGLVFPFPQPFFEGYTAWGHILFVRKPQSIPQIRHIWEFGRNSGVIQKDAEGEFFIPWHPLNTPLHLLGLLPDDKNLKMRLSSLSMLSSSTVEVNGFPVPVPGADPALSIVMQSLGKDSTSDAFVSYFMQFGAKTSIVPFPIEAALRVVSPERFGEDRVASMTLWVMRDLQYTGRDLDENGDPLPYDVLYDLAQHEAEQLVIASSLSGLSGPTTGSISWKFQPLLDELNRLRDDLGFAEGTDEFNRKYDYRYTLMTVGTTEFEGEDLAGREQPRIPSSEFVAKLTSTPEGSKFLKEYPPWFGLLLVGTDPEVANAFSMPYYSRQIQNGQSLGKDPKDFATEGQSTAAWAEWISWKESIYNPLYEQWLREDNGNTDTWTYTQLKALRQDKLTDMNRHWPLWGNEYLRFEPSNLEGTDGHYDFAFGDPDAMPDQAVFASAETLANDPEWQGVPGVQALQYYLDERTKIAEAMEERGYSDIRHPDAIEEGLDVRYENVLATIEERWPEASPLINSYFAGDLTGMESSQLDAYRGPQGQEIFALDQEYRDLKLNEKDYEFTWEYYNRLNETTKWKNDQWVIPAKLEGAALEAATKRKDAFKLWFDTEYPPGSPNHREYVRNLGFREPAFMSAFDLEQLGLKLTPRAAGWVNEYAEARTELSKMIDAGQNVDVGDYYDQLDAWVAARANKDDSFARWRTAQNQFGWGLNAAGLIEQPGQVGEAWEDIYWSLQGIKKDLVDKYDLSGINYGTDEEKWLYRDVRKQFMGYIDETYLSNKQWAGYNQFKAQWDEQRVGGFSVIEFLMPDDYFPFGKVEKAA